MVQPSILIFSLSVCVVIVLVAAEITTQRRKAGKSCCGYGTKNTESTVDAFESDKRSEESDSLHKVDGLVLEEEGSTRKRRGVSRRDRDRGAGVIPREKNIFEEDQSDFELQVLVSSDSDYD